jgi:hypothetical protein
MRPTCAVNLTFLELIILIIFREKYELWSSSLRRLLLHFRTVPSVFWGGARLSPLGTSATKWSNVPAADEDKCLLCIWWLGIVKSSADTWPSVACSTGPAWHELEAGERWQCCQCRWTSRKTNRVTVTNINWLMLLGVTVNVYLENYTNPYRDLWANYLRINYCIRFAVPRCWKFLLWSSAAVFSPFVRVPPEVNYLKCVPPKL